ncbi:polysaccharide deacetylase family protein [Priestia megaterium]|nr:polysaccharide deacetylase family protein [Priestia megaterium]
MDNFISWISASLLVAFLCYTVGASALYRRFASSVIIKGAKKHKISLTFDDGPNPVYTPKLLDLLKQYDMKATFFVVGTIAEQHPHILQRMVKEGHEVAIHHHRHISAWLLTPSQLKKEIQLCSQAIERITGKKPQFYRPPWGHLNVSSIVMASPYQVVIWSGIFGDWSLKTTTATLIEQLKSHLESGSIYVLHDNGDTLGADEKAPEQMIEALKEFIPYAKQQGYTSETLQELMKEG